MNFRYSEGVLYIAPEHLGCCVKINKARMSACYDADGSISYNRDILNVRTVIQCDIEQRKPSAKYPAT